MKIKQNKLMNYCAIPAGVLASAASVSGATVIIYGDSDIAPVGVDVGWNDFNSGLADVTSSSDSRFSMNDDGDYFTDGSIDLDVWSNSSIGLYSSNSGASFHSGATMGDQNYANISFDGPDSVYEAVAQFFFDGAGGGYLVAVAFADTVANPNTTDLSLIGGTSTYAITAGKAAIDAAAVPEPSSVALLALGATGLLMRRQRKAA